MRSRRVAAASLLVVALATALAVTLLRSEEAPALLATETTTTMSITTSTSLTTTTTTAETTTTSFVLVDDGPPAVDLRAETFEELRLVWDQIDAYWAWLNAHPTDDPEVLGVIFHPDGVEFARQREGYTAAIAAGIRVLEAGAGAAIAWSHPEAAMEMANGGISVGLITAHPQMAKTVDLSGNTLETFPGWDSRQWILRLARDLSGSWLVWSLDRA